MGRCTSQLWSVPFTLEVLHRSGERPAHVDVLAQRLQGPLGTDVSATTAAALCAQPASTVIPLPATLPPVDAAWGAFRDKGYGLSAQLLDAGRLGAQLKVRVARARVDGTRAQVTTHRLTAARPRNTRPTRPRRFNLTAQVMRTRPRRWRRP